MNKITALVLVYSSLLIQPSFTFAADNLKTPHQIISDLRQRMYAVGETTGQLNNFIEAERKAAQEIHDYASKGGSQEALVEKNNSGQTPLMAASFMGYGEVVNELLKYDNVRKGINDTKPTGESAWFYSNLGFHQTMWVCNPTVFNDPFTWVPLFVTQPYYVLSPENPYKKTRRVLEAAGAKPDLSLAKKLWADKCKLQDESTKKKVEATEDFLETVLVEGTEKLTRFIAERQRAMK